MVARLQLSDFAPTLGVKPWAASHLVSVATRRADADRAFRKRLNRTRAQPEEITFSQI